MLEFQKITPDQREKFEKYLLPLGKSCEYTFTNLCIWGRQRATMIDEYLVLFSHFDRRAVYPFPAGQGDIKPVLDRIILDALERGIPCCITGLDRENMDLLEQLYPGKFTFQCDRDSFDYVYNIDDLADLKGRKYQKKRNHVNKFRTLYPDAQTEVMTPAHLPEVREMTKQWYVARQQMDPTGSYTLEQVALDRAFDHFEALKLEGMVLRIQGKIAAFTMASRLSENTMDVHFEKALEDIDGAYAAINQAFAQHLREKYPEIRYLDREDDMGLEGLRKAKLSYCPDHLKEKCWARLWEESDGC
jgi:hypothetical protein